MICGGVYRFLFPFVLGLGFATDRVPTTEIPCHDMGFGTQDPVQGHNNSRMQGAGNQHQGVRLEGAKIASAGQVMGLRQTPRNGTLTPGRLPAGKRRAFRKREPQNELFMLVQI